MSSSPSTKQCLQVYDLWLSIIVIRNLHFYSHKVVFIQYVEIKSTSSLSSYTDELEYTTFFCNEGKNLNRIPRPLQVLRPSSDLRVSLYACLFSSKFENTMQFTEYYSSKLGAYHSPIHSKVLIYQQVGMAPSRMYWENFLKLVSNCFKLGNISIVHK